MGEILKKNSDYNLPDNPGVYFFYNNKKELIYVGKATSLKKRVKSYFQGQKTERPIEKMLSEIKNVKFEVTDSVIEAIILEANYIRELQPKYNVLGRDDKSFNYLALTNEDYPKIISIREHEVKEMGDILKKEKFLELFGPFPNLKTKEMLKLLRKLFFIANCEKNKTNKPCFYYQIKECLGVCAGEISEKKYAEKVVKPLKKFLEGGKIMVIKNFEKEMKKEAMTENFERAKMLRDQIKNLKIINDITLINRSFVEGEKLKISNFTPTRIEGYDISNLSSEIKVASMVVMENDEIKKSEYRKFQIKTVEGQSDVDCLKEVILRRFKHNEWKFPDLILIDGGAPQVESVLKVLRFLKINIPVFGIAKGAERKRNDFYIKNLTKDAILFVRENKEKIIILRDESHRFAKKFLLEKKNLKN
jgi:excinuclease UvrABC nuclease subunit